MQDTPAPLLEDALDPQSITADGYPVVVPVSGAKGDVRLTLPSGMDTSDIGIHIAVRDGPGGTVYVELNGRTKSYSMNRKTKLFYQKRNLRSGDNVLAWSLPSDLEIVGFVLDSGDRLGKRKVFSLLSGADAPASAPTPDEPEPTPTGPVLDPSNRCYERVADSFTAEGVDASWPTNRTGGRSAGGIAVGDFDGDGCHSELLIVQENRMGLWDVRDGKRLWLKQNTNQYLSSRFATNGPPGYGAPGVALLEDGRLVFVTRDDRLAIIDGRTGSTIATPRLPGGGYRGVMTAELDGSGGSELVLVKATDDNEYASTRTTHLFAVELSELERRGANAQALWSTARFVGTAGHLPAAFDLDNDGREEIIGGTVANGRNGAIMFDLGITVERLTHIDSLCVTDGLVVAAIQSPTKTVRTVRGYDHRGVRWIDRSHIGVTDGDKVTCLGDGTFHLRGSESRNMWGLDDKGEVVEDFEFAFPAGFREGLENLQPLQWEGRSRFLALARHEDGDAGVFSRDGDLLTRFDGNFVRGLSAQVYGNSNEEVILIAGRTVKIFTSARGGGEADPWKSDAYRACKNRGSTYYDSCSRD